MGDYDNDGFLDIFVANGSIYGAERNGLYRNNGNDNSWIKIKCVGTVSNRSAIGTKIRVKANIGGTDQWQMRHIVGTEGWLSFNSLDVVVGLGDAQTIDTLRVEWPSGIVQEWHNVAVKQTLTLVEPLNLEIARQSVDEFLLSVHGRPGQAYRVEASTDLKTWLPVTYLETPPNAGAASHIYSPAENKPFQFFRAIRE